MNIETFLGKSKSIVEDIAGDHLVATNAVNNTVEVCDIKCSFDNKGHHALFYFDLADKRQMTMALIKIENVSFFTRMKLKLSKEIRCEGYVGSLTFLNDKSIIIAYLRENIFEAL